VKPVELPRVPTGNPGVDQILLGGLPQNRTTLISGGPGCGKSILGLEFLVRGALAGEAGVLVAFEERPDAIRANALTLGWDLASLERKKRLALIDGHIDYEMIMAGTFDLRGLLAIIAGSAKQIKARRLVLDALDVLLRYFNDSGREREQLFFLNDWLAENNFTSVLTVKRGANNETNGHYEFLDYLADCVIHLDQRVTEQVTTRRLRVVKYRGSNYGRNEYLYVLQPHKQTHWTKWFCRCRKARLSARSSLVGSRRRESRPAFCFHCLPGRPKPGDEAQRRRPV
jgi:circadian clock protein KaiC